MPVKLVQQCRAHHPLRGLVVRLALPGEAESGQQTRRCERLARQVHPQDPAGKPAPLACSVRGLHRKSGLAGSGQTCDNGECGPRGPGAEEKEQLFQLCGPPDETFGARGQFAARHDFEAGLFEHRSLSPARPRERSPQRNIRAALRHLDVCGPGQQGRGPWAHTGATVRKRTGRGQKQQGPPGGVREHLLQRLRHLLTGQRIGQKKIDVIQPHHGL